MSGCEKCNWTGRVTCPKCDGKKKVKCKKCDGHGTFADCPDCDSTGKIDCPSCGGSGDEISICPVCEKGKIIKTRWINCADCYGKGYYMGPGCEDHPECCTCHGRGQVKDVYEDICPNCHGEYNRKTGRPCKKCGGTGEIECSQCEGTGHAKCQECDGSGEVACKNCYGTGHVDCDCTREEKERLKRKECQEKERRRRELRAIMERRKRRLQEEKALREKREQEERKKRIAAREAQEKKEAAEKAAKEREKAAKERRDAIQGCGCLIAIVAVVGFFIWWWMEGMTMSVLPGMWEQAKNTLVGSSWGIVSKVGGGILVLLLGWLLLKGIKGNKGEVSTSSKKRWKFVVLGMLFGFLGVHLAYAKRWVLFLLLWAGFITGNVMTPAKSEPGEKPAEATTQHAEPAGNANKGGSSPISNIGFGVWSLLWLGGTLFIKKDGKGKRM